MPEVRITPGSTSKSIHFKIYKDDGTVNTSLVYNSSNLAASYKRDTSAATSITLATLASATASYSSGGFVHVASGLYRLDLPNAAIATGASICDIIITDATDIRPEPFKIVLDEIPTVSSGAVTVGTVEAGAIDENAIGDGAYTVLAGPAYRAMAAMLGYSTVYYVSPSGNNGSNGTTPDSCKLTLAGAQSAASAGSLIIVLPGTYDENNLGKDGVDWYLSPGAFIHYTGTNRNPIFGDGGVAKRYRITGSGRILNACASAGSGSGDSAAISLSAGSVVQVKAQSIASDSGVSPNACGIVIGHASAVLVADIAEAVYSTQYDAIVATAGRLHLKTPALYSVADGSAIETGGSSTIYITADRMSAGSGEAVIDAVGGTLTIKANHITNGGTGTSVNNEDADLTLVGAKVAGTTSVAGSSAKLRLLGCDTGAITISTGGEVLADYATRTGTVTGGSVTRVGTDGIRDAILNRFLPGNHDTSDTVGQYLQTLVSYTDDIRAFTENQDVDVNGRIIIAGTVDTLDVNVVSVADGAISNQPFNSDFSEFLRNTVWSLTDADSSAMTTGYVGQKFFEVVDNAEAAKTAAENASDIADQFEFDSTTGYVKATSILNVDAGDTNTNALAGMAGEWTDLNDLVTTNLDAQVSQVGGGGGGSAGNGDIAVNHDTGGTDNLRFTTSGGTGIDEATVRAYLKAEYDAGTRTVRAQVYTGSDGRWVEDMMLDAGTYRFVFSKDGYETASIEQAVA